MFVRNLRFAAALLIGLGAGRLAAQCPAQTATGQAAYCGVEYGGQIQYCYANAQNWWFSESVVQGMPNDCQEGGIDQTSNPFQKASGCVSDLITNSNGPPAGLPACTDVTNQTVYAGPTEATANQCNYPNVQQIQVTQNPNQVVTSSAGASTVCAY